MAWSVLKIGWRSADLCMACWHLHARCAEDHRSGRGMPLDRDHNEITRLILADKCDNSQDNFKSHLQKERQCEILLCLW